VISDSSGVNEGWRQLFVHDLFPVVPVQFHDLKIHFLVSLHSITLICVVVPMMSLLFKKNIVSCSSVGAFI
jgi:hypothetical protein